MKAQPSWKPEAAEDNDDIVGLKEQDDEDRPMRTVSGGTERLAKLRAKLEDLEMLKAERIAESEEVSKDLRSKILADHRKLDVSIQTRLTKLRDVTARANQLFPTVVADDSHYTERVAAAGRDAELAIVWFGEVAAGTDIATAKRHLAALHAERVFLEQTALAAKVMAQVASLTHKKLLNLAHDTLLTFLPHCLAKVNRVSFGLLNDDECKEALDDDPHCPPSRLALAVPFMGKDVPAKSSEFAHPDVVITVSVLAYRYQGLRWSDFTELIDQMTTEFQAEIGPAKDRPSSKRHEEWVNIAGGKVRGLLQTDGQKTAGSSDKEVVQLKYLQKSNVEQMEKLYGLWKLEPQVLHYYIAKSVFPTHTRAQRVKISASGQAVGGDMLVGRRVGFSGTPSDLLPAELGKCEYEKGDDGKMLTTVIDPRITSYEYVPEGWSVEMLLENIARSSSPVFHALIDTGALITGYSNLEVAEKLLECGLDWCDGVVFLDNADKQQVLVRATRRVVSADQCGVPLTRRFAFYDQIHTTGMDISHVVNAKAAITLGKDMVFRDYVQGAFRMRGIGAGQTIHVLIIPEVKELMARELRYVGDPLKDIAAWLTINSMRSEKTQWSMLCLQNVSNAYRKPAFNAILTQGAHWVPEVTGATASEANGAKAVPSISKLGTDESLAVFNESMDFALEAAVPDPTPFDEKLKKMLEDHSKFMTFEEMQVGYNVMEEVGRFAAYEKDANKLDTEQEREQEQEQQKEVQARRDQQVEVEKFVDREYSRQEETPQPWSVGVLSDEKAARFSADAPDADELAFYALNEFRLRHGQPLSFPPQLLLSRNYFNPKWTGLRRVKNVVMLMEWAPSAEPSALHLASDADRLAGAAPLTNEQESALAKAHQLLGFHAAAAGIVASLSPRDVRAAVRAVCDSEPSDEEVEALLHEFGDADSGQAISCDGFRKVRAITRAWLAAVLGFVRLRVCARWFLLLCTGVPVRPRVLEWAHLCLRRVRMRLLLL